MHSEVRKSETIRIEAVCGAILLDVIVADLHGFHLLSKFCAQAVFGEIPVVMLTGKASREDIVRGLNAGAAGYMTKPVAVDSLAHSIRAVLGFRQVDRSKDGAGTHVVA